jgi:CRP/FNR family cyclic AMP-dependent transcriptional regulator
MFLNRMACHFRLLDALDSVLQERLLDGHRELKVPANHQLIFEADWGEEVYILTEGIFKVRSLTRQGDEVVISLMGSGAVIGDVALLFPKSIRTADVVSLTPATLIKLRQNVFRQVLRDSPQLLNAVAQLQAQRLKALGERLMLMNEDAMTRLLATLLNLTRLNGMHDSPANPIPPLSQKEIATIAGLSRGTTSTLINKLRLKGTLFDDENDCMRIQPEPLIKRGLL